MLVSQLCFAALLCSFALQLCLAALRCSFVLLCRSGMFEAGVLACMHLQIAFASVCANGFWTVLAAAWYRALSGCLQMACKTSAGPNTQATANLGCAQQEAAAKCSGRYRGSGRCYCRAGWPGQSRGWARGLGPGLQLGPGAAAAGPVMRARAVRRRPSCTNGSGCPIIHFRDSAYDLPSRSAPVHAFR